ncbi:GL14157 [Drosophila persimilis]|uniref:RNA-directed DNA polymerase n=1 Tax=Drosophila persimilis TaxID=7234 RepID=B4HCK7_DROPE|nr:GL14157 [Drosophila persimilis]
MQSKKKRRETRAVWDSTLNKFSHFHQLKPPTNIKELRQYLGVASWYRRFVPDFATLVQPLTGLLKKKTEWVWTQERQEAFEEVKRRLVAKLVLACPDFSKKFILQTDASDYGLDAMLTQETERGERVISYASRTLNGPERNYSATEKEYLAIVWAIRRLRPYLEGYRFKVVTDHKALKWLNSIETPSGRVAR